MICIHVYNITVFFIINRNTWIIWKGNILVPYSKNRRKCRSYTNEFNTAVDGQIHLRREKRLKLFTLRLILVNEIKGNFHTILDRYITFFVHPNIRNISYKRSISKKFCLDTNGRICSKLTRSNTNIYLPI